jgi:hopanoid biosynthesis associated RND transporter like protein HpnN
MRTEPGREEETIVSRLIVAVVGLAGRFPRTTLAVTLALCGLSLYACANYLTFRTQRDDLVSPKKDYQERWQQYVNEFGDDDDMVVVVQGRDRPTMERALEALAVEVQKQPALFDRLFYKVDLRHLRNRALLFLPADQIRQIQDNLRSMDMLLNPPFIANLDPLFGWKSLTLGHLLNEAEQRALARAGEKTLRPGDEQLFTQLASVCSTAEAVLRDPDRYQSPWGSIQPASGQKDLLAEPQYFFSGDGTLAFLLVRPVKDHGTFTMAQKSIAAMRDIVADVGGRFRGLQVGLTGLPVLENDETAASQDDSGTASWLSLAGVILVYLVVFRSPRYPLLSVGALLVAMGWAMGWLTLTVGHLNILSATFAAMLIGMGDYGVLLVTRYEQERGAGADVHAALRATAAGVGPSIFTGATTTAIAFFVAMLADFQAVAELGWIAGCGVYFCVLAVFTVLPAALCLTDRRPRPEPVTIPVHPGGLWLPRLLGRPRWVVGLGLGVTAVMAVCATRVTYDHNLLHLQAQSLDSVQWELKLIDHTEGASWHTLSYTSTQEEALELKHRFEKLPVVQRVVTAADMVPLEQDRKLEQLRDIQARLRRLPPRRALLAHAPPNPADLKARLARLEASLAAGPGPSPLTARLAASLRGLQGQLDVLVPAEAARRLLRLEQLMTRDLAEDLYRLREVSTPEPITVADLPPSLRERYLGKNGKWLLQVFGNESLWEFAPLKQFVEQVRAVDPDATGKPFSTLEGLIAMKKGFEMAGWYALAAMAIVLLLDLRNLWHTVLALAPLALGIVCAVGVLGLLGLPLNPANMLAFPLILGVGADNGVLIIKDYRQQRRRLYNLSLPMGRGVLVVALTTILGFGSLMISRHRGLASLGLVLIIGVSCCMVTALVFLPAVLRLLSGRKQREAEAASAAVLQRASVGPLFRREPRASA